MNKREFYAGIVGKQRDARRIAMALARLHEAAKSGVANTRDRHVGAAIRLLGAVVVDKRTHVTAARAANRELVRNARVLRRLPDESQK